MDGPFENSSEKKKHTIGEEEKESQNEKYIFVKTKDFELRELKDVDPERRERRRVSLPQCDARGGSCAEIACVDDEER